MNAATRAAAWLADWLAGSHGVMQGLGGHIRTIEGQMSLFSRVAFAILQTSVVSYERDRGAEGRLRLLQPLAAVPARSAAGAQGACNRTSDVPAARLLSPARLESNSHPSSNVIMRHHVANAEVCDLCLPCAAPGLIVSDFLPLLLRCCTERQTLLRSKALHVQILGHADFASRPLTLLLGHDERPYALHGLPLPSGWRPALHSKSLPWSCLLEPQLRKVRDKA